MISLIPVKIPLDRSLSYFLRFLLKKDSDRSVEFFFDMYDFDIHFHPRLSLRKRRDSRDNKVDHFFV